MQPINSESINENHLRQWIKELTDYTPQQVDRVVEKMRETYKAA